MVARDSDALLAFDREHVWHPYGALPGALEPLPVVSAQGVRLTLGDGRELIDGMSSWWCAIHGYRHPDLDRALSEQLERMAHVMFGGLTHEPAVRLAERLLALAPEGLEAVFFADSGSVSVEVAIKMCLQFHRARGDAQRTRLLTVRGGYHGDTFGAMAICDPVGGMHSLFAGVLAEHVFAERPPDGFDAGLDERWAAQLRELTARHACELAAIVVEPVVQGAGGMRFHSPACVALMRELCDEHGLLLVLDEIATGFGRTGELFACEHAAVAPDVMCVGKALTGGYLTLAATLCTREVADAVSAGEGGGLMHGPTFMANPLACSVALASLALLEDEQWRARVAAIEQGLRAGLEAARELPGVADVRVLGAIGVLQLDHDVDMAAATQAAVAHGVWLRPFRDLVYAMPPYVIGEQELTSVTDAMLAAVVAG
ncbi:MAG: adenosylmethionine--8-amino-7-oxononanoate transaminase [Solirubrobacteraceae bacterium]